MPEGSPSSQAGDPLAGAKTWEVLSLGAGVQSTCLLLMSIEGLVDKLDFAIFCDTGWEPPEVYEHLDALARVAAGAGIEVHRAAQGVLPDDVLDRRKFATLPAWTPKGRIKRQCTPKYKVEPLERRMRELLGAKVAERPCKKCDGTGERVAPWDEAAGLGPCSICGGTGTQRVVNRMPKGTQVNQWIGFSTDEMDRATTAGFPKWSTPRHPLLELGWTRQDCIRWMASIGWKGVAKSACMGCPFHDDETWLDLATQAPTQFAQVVDFDAKFRWAPGMREARFLHERRLPLADAVEQYRLQKEAAGEQGLLWPEMKARRKIRRCNPFGCRSEEVDDDVLVVSA